MIQQQSILKVSDNSGAKTVKCIKVLGGFKKKQASIGDILVVSIQSLRNILKQTSKVQRKEIYKALLIKTKTKLKKKDGSEMTFTENAVILLNNTRKPIGTRILGPVPRFLKKKKFQQVLSISAGLV